MKTLAVHASTQQELAILATSPPQAIILVGPAGSGKLSLATGLAETILNEPDFAAYPYGLTVQLEDSQSIGIEAVRQLEHFLSLKVPNNKALGRVVIIEDAHLMTVEAQNALLKTLEEPPQGTMFLLTASQEQSLLPTIRSRAQSISVKRPGRSELATLFKDYDLKTFDQAYAISAGLPGLLYALLNDEEHPLRQATEQARQLLSQTSYQRLLLVDGLAKQRQLTADTCFILQQMAHVSLQTATGEAAKKWKNVLHTSYQAAEALATAAQPKLALTKLMLSL